uniref:Uncharacterized protein n=1 Tax=Romanomermis culicivorax TaxID=13658 RepID=A0A915KCY9_ROMCU
MEKGPPTSVKGVATEAARFYLQAPRLFIRKQLNRVRFICKQSACYPCPLSTIEATVDCLFVLPLLPYPRVAYRNHRPFLG